jgi:hypothetical protein
MDTAIIAAFLANEMIAFMTASCSIPVIDADVQVFAGCSSSLTPRYKNGL